LTYLAFCGIIKERKEIMSRFDLPILEKLSKYCQSGDLLYRAYVKHKKAAFWNGVGGITCLVVNAVLLGLCFFTRNNDFLASSLAILILDGFFIMRMNHAMELAEVFFLMIMATSKEEDEAE